MAYENELKTMKELLNALETAPPNGRTVHEANTLKAMLYGYISLCEQNKHCTDLLQKIDQIRNRMCRINIYAGAVVQARMVSALQKIIRKE